MKNLLHYFVLALALLTLAACGGGGSGGGSGSNQTPTTSTYTLDFASGGNGTLSGAASQSVTLATNSNTVTAVPSSGYHFVNWTEGGSAVGVNAALTVTNVTANHSFTANFTIDALAKTTAILAVNMTGALPASKTISGADFTITLPANVTPATTNGVIATGVVTLTGTFAGSTLSPQVVYTAATASTPGTMKVILASSAAAGLSQVGEMATINLQLANGAVPTASSFVVSGDSIIDATLYVPITGMNVVVTSVALQ